MNILIKKEGVKINNKAIELYRGDLIESCHNAHIAVVDYNGNLLYYLGDAERITYARSAIKPIQAIQVVETGAIRNYEIEDKELAIMCASHSGEKYHVDTVKGILSKANISVDKLNCGTHPLTNLGLYREIIIRGEEVTTLHNNCSGKHSGMLISAKWMNEDLDTYLESNHPVQKRILSDISRVCDYNKDDIQIGIDGCGAPVHALPLERLAYGFARMAKPETLGMKGKTITKITEAMTSFPEMIGGTNRFCTDFMEVCGHKMFGKVGAEGVYLIGIKEQGIGIGIKVEDGDLKATYSAVLEVLRQLDLVSKEELTALSVYYTPNLLNARNEVIGKMVPNFELRKN